MKLTFCPFSLAVFIGTAAYVTSQQRSLRRSNDNAEKDVTNSTNTDDDDAVLLSATSLPSCQVVFVLGGPGAGKGTQCELLTQRFPDWTHFSAGDLLRAERNKKHGPLSDIINSCIAQGQLVPSSVTCKCIENAMKRQYLATGCRKFVIDGFPRSHDNAAAWKDMITINQQQQQQDTVNVNSTAASTITIEFVLYLECPEDVMMGRLLQRERSDDTADVIKKRFEIFMQETAPVISFYEKEGLLKTIQADKAVQDVFKEVSVLFENL